MKNAARHNEHIGSQRLESYIDSLEAYSALLASEKKKQELIVSFQNDPESVKEGLRQLNVGGRGRKVSEACLDLIEGEYLDAEVFSILGCAFQSMDELELAKQAFKAGNSIDPNNPQIISNMAVCLALMDDHVNALKWIEQAIDLDKSNAAFQDNRKIILSASNPESEDVTSRAKVLEIDPNG